MQVAQLLYMKEIRWRMKLQIHRSTGVAQDSGQRQREKWRCTKGAVGIPDCQIHLEQFQNAVSNMCNWASTKITDANIGLLNDCESCSLATTVQCLCSHWDRDLLAIANTHIRWWLWHVSILLSLPTSPYLITVTAYMDDFQHSHSDKAVSPVDEWLQTPTQTRLYHQSMDDQQHSHSDKDW